MRRHRNDHRVDPMRLGFFQSWIRVVNERGWTRTYQEEILKHFTGKTSFAECTTFEIQHVLVSVGGLIEEAEVS